MARHHNAPQPPRDVALSDRVVKVTEVWDPTAVFDLVAIPLPYRLIEPASVVVDPLNAVRVLTDTIVIPILSARAASAAFIPPQRPGERQDEQGRTDNEAGRHS